LAVAGHATVRNEVSLSRQREEIAGTVDESGCERIWKERLLSQVRTCNISLIDCRAAYPKLSWHADGNSRSVLVEDVEA
jgi:hypothetical protein